MPKNPVIGIEFKAVVDDFLTKVNKVMKSTKLANSEFKAVTSSMDNWSSTQAGLEAKIKQLNTVIDIENESLEKMQTQLKKAMDEGEAGAPKVEYWTTKINNQIAKVTKASKELATYEDKLERLKTTLKANVKPLEQIDAEFKLVTSSMKDWKTSTVGVQAKITQLTDKIKYEQNELSLLNAELEKAKKNNDTSKVNQLTTAIANQTSKINQLNLELTDYNELLGKLNKPTAVEELSNELAQQKARFEQATIGIDDYRTSTDAMNMKLRELNLTIQLEEAKLSELEQALSKAETQYGATSRQAMELKTRIAQQTTVVAKSKKAYEEEYKAVNKLLKTRSGFIGFLNNIISGTKDLEKENKKLSDGFTVLKGVISHYISHTLTSFFGTLKNLLRTSRALRKEIGMLKATAETQNFDTKELEHAESMLKKIYTVIEDTGAGTEALNNLISAGFKTDSLDKITDQLLGASIKWKDTLSMEGLSDSIQEAIGSKGASITGQFAELLERMGVDLDQWSLEFDGLTTDAERQQKIMDALAKGGLTDVLDEYKEINKTLIEENKQVYDTLDISKDFGEIVNPIILRVRAGLNGILLKLLELIKHLGGGDLEAGIAKIQGMIDRFFEVVYKGMDWITNNLDILVGSLTALIGLNFGSKMATGILTVVTGFTKFKEAANGAEGALNLLKNGWGGLDKAFKSSIIGLIIAAVLLLVAGLVQLYKKNEEFKKSIDSLLESLKPLFEEIMSVIKDLIPPLKEIFNVIIELVGKVITSIMPIITTIVDVLTNLLVPILQVLTPIITKIVEFLSMLLVPAIESIGEKLKMLFAVVEFVVGGIINWFKTWADFVKSVFQTIIAIFTGDTDKIKEIWSNFAERLKESWDNLWNGLIDGLKNGFKNIFESWKKAWDKLINWFKDLFGIHSPSTLMSDFGKNIMQGLIDGIKALFGKISDVVTSIANFFTSLPSKIWNKIKGIGDTIKDAFTTAVDKVKDIGKDIVSGLWSGIKSKTEWVKGKITGFCEKIGKSITDFFDINSPSKWAIEKGSFIGEGVGIGVLNSTRGVLKDVNRFNEKVAGGINVTPTSGNGGASGSVIDASLTVNYNGQLSLKEMKKLQNNYYTNVKRVWG